MPLTHLVVEGKRFGLDDPALSNHYPISYLALVKDQRVWKGVPSVTQVISGTRESYLKIVSDYDEDPDAATYRVVGTRGHSLLQEHALEPKLAEVKIADDDLTAVVDALEEHDDGWWLVDYKVWGSYKVGKILGVRTEDRQITDANGKPVYFKNGNPKMRKETVRDPSAADFGDLAMQVNSYALKAEKLLGEMPVRLKAFLIVRDAGTQSAKSRGIDRNCYYVDVPWIERELVEAFNARKGTALVRAVEQYEKCLADGLEREDAIREAMPPMCDPEEHWQYRKCLGYCSVAKTCARLGGHPEAAKILGDGHELENF